MLKCRNFIKTYILRKNYLSDYERIEFIDEANYYINQLDNIVCPICSSKINEVQIDIQSIKEGIDAEKIIKHYLSGKNAVANLDVKQLARILNGRSCAELETIINQAGIYAGFENKERVMLFCL